jgi:hypothetical protein
MNKIAFACFAILLGFSAIADKPALKMLYDQHRWFELREAIKDQAPPLYKGAVASAFNDPTAAAKYFNEAITSQPDSHSADDSRDMLTDLYGRYGRYHDALHELDESLKIHPGRADLVNARLLYAEWAKHGDQSADAVPPSTSRGHFGREGIVLPVAIHGKTAHWALDTGANFSLISEKEATLFGIPIDEAPASITDAAGGSSKIRTAVSDEISIGGATLRNVAFLVLPDTQEPMSDLQPGERGLIGIQIPVALRSMDWKSDGTFQIGSSAAERTNPQNNLCFDGLMPVMRVLFEAKQLDFELDSGEQSGSQLWTRFAADFAPLLKERGIKTKNKVTQVGGSNERDIVELPEIHFLIGGFDATLHPARVFSKPVGNDFHYGHIGMDVLSQARELRLDFVAMTLQLVR